MPVGLGPFVILFILVLSAMAEPPPSAQEILATVRMRQSEQQIDLNGQLRENGVVIPFRIIQDSGIHWGLGSDATAVTTSNPFYTLSLAVTGKMIGGRQVNRQTITREEALIAHTRSNASFVFQEGNLGSLAPGKYADLLVLDRDYLTVPADEIKDIKPLITMVGGKVVYEVAPR